MHSIARLLLVSPQMSSMSSSSLGCYFYIIAPAVVPCDWEIFGPWNLTFFNANFLFLVSRDIMRRFVICVEKGQFSWAKYLASTWLTISKIRIYHELHTNPLTACFNAGMRIKFLQDRINGDSKVNAQNPLFGPRYNMNNTLMLTDNALAQSSQVVNSSQINPQMSGQYPPTSHLLTLNLTDLK